MDEDSAYPGEEAAVVGLQTVQEALCAEPVQHGAGGGHHQGRLDLNLGDDRARRLERASDRRAQAVLELDVEGEAASYPVPYSGGHAAQGRCPPEGGELVSFGELGRQEPVAMAPVVTGELDHPVDEGVESDRSVVDGVAHEGAQRQRVRT